jgi:hypothetical protein
MKKHGDMELKKFTFREDESSPTIAFHDFMKTKVDRDGTIVKVVKSGSMCGITETQSGTTKSICDTTKSICDTNEICPLPDSSYHRPSANFTYTANAALAPQNFSLSGNIDVFPYNYEKEDFSEKAAHVNIDAQLSTNENTATKFSQKLSLNIKANLEQANTNIKFSLDGSQTTEKVGKRVIDPVSESIDVIEILKGTFGKINKSLDSTFEDAQNKALSTAKIADIHILRTAIEVYWTDNFLLPESSNGCMLNISVISDLMPPKSRQEIINLLENCKIKYVKMDDDGFYLLSKLESESQANLFLTDDEFQNFSIIPASDLSTFVTNHKTKMSESQS